MCLLFIYDQECLTSRPVHLICAAWRGFSKCNVFIVVLLALNYGAKGCHVRRYLTLWEWERAGMGCGHPALSCHIFCIFVSLIKPVLVKLQQLKQMKFSFEVALIHFSVYLGSVQAANTTVNSLFVSFFCMCLWSFCYFASPHPSLVTFHFNLLLLSWPLPRLLSHSSTLRNTPVWNGHIYHLLLLTLLLRKN